MKYSENDTFFVVREWYGDTNGLHDGTFYGARTPDGHPNILEPIVVRGQDAKTISSHATKNGMVFLTELSYTTHDSRDLDSNPDQDSDPLAEWISKNAADVWINKDGDLFVNFPEDCSNTEDALESLVESCPECAISWDYGAVPADEGWMLLEVTSTGGIAAGVSTSFFDDPYIDKSRFGLNSRAGHGHKDNLGPKKVRVGKNTTKGSTKNAKSDNKIIQGIRKAGRMDTISQTGGKIGGNNR